MIPCYDESAILRHSISTNLLTINQHAFLSNGSALRTSFTLQGVSKCFSISSRGFPYCAFRLSNFTGGHLLRISISSSVRRLLKSIHLYLPRIDTSANASSSGKLIRLRISDTERFPLMKLSVFSRRLSTFPTLYGTMIPPLLLTGTMSRSGNEYGNSCGSFQCRGMS